MPFKSKSQQRKFFSMEGRGEIAKGTAEDWMKETPNFKTLPKKIDKPSAPPKLKLMKKNTLRMF